MKAVVIREHGGIEKLLYEDVEQPSAGPGEVLVKIGASGVNHLDHDLREGIAGMSWAWKASAKWSSSARAC